MEATWIKSKNEMLPGKAYFSLRSHQNYYVSQSHVMLLPHFLAHNFSHAFAIFVKFCNFGQKTLSLVDKINVHEKRALLGS